MRPSNWTPRYIYNRLRQAAFEWKNPGAPWLTPYAVSLIDELIRPTDYLLEFGSGRSTIWLAQRCRAIVSVEHDKEWFEKVSPQIKNLSNVDYRHAKLEAPAGHVPPYLSLLDEFPDESFDVLINDGRLRHLVAEKATSKLKPGGLLVLDNAERYLPQLCQISDLEDSAPTKKNWAEFLKQVENWRKIPTTNGIWSTIILLKP
mgnify:CR=1 FL=1